MDYVYDIILNFQNKYYDFYEWKSSDKIINVKKIPIYKVDTHDYLNIKNNDVIIDKDSLVKNSKMFLITNGLEVMGIMIIESGRVIKKSSLIFEEADEIIDDSELIKKIKIKYKIDKKRNIRYVSRMMEEKSTYINDYLKKIDDKYLLKYLYYDIYNKDIDDMDKMYKDLYSLLKTDIFKIYEAIQRVNLELKR